ncbi:MAG TPA: T9SS type A sorting domain-containing protein [Chitinophagales bacterium]|nr:T9SS type A sorting domain-containing protein [Chitinophagales bacterium]
MQHSYSPPKNDKVFLSAFILILSFNFSGAQNLITNGDFEQYYNCPTFLGMVNECTDWHSIIESPDYYDCNFLIYPAFPTADTVAYSGTGWMGFASYGDAGGACEAIGQSLSSPILEGQTYALTLAAKKANGGTWSQTCGGIAIYGFKDSLPPNSTGVHAEDFPGSIFLGKTDTVDNLYWQLYTFNFTSPDTINHVVFTIEKTPNCSECAFIDGVSIHSGKGTHVASPGEHSNAAIFPNPGNGDFTLLFGKLFEETTIEVTDITGRTILSELSMPGTSMMQLNLSSQSEGLYFVRISDRIQTTAIPIQIIR